jgi:hypothetical protein
MLGCLREREVMVNWHAATMELLFLLVTSYILLVTSYINKFEDDADIVLSFSIYLSTFALHTNLYIN